MSQTNQFLIIWFLFIMCMLMMAVAISDRKKDAPISTLTTEGVIHQIQELSRLNTAAYSVDTVVTSTKEGTWYKLWQDEQKGLFVVRGRVLAGVDLSHITSQQVVVETTPADKESKTPAQTSIAVTLPAPQIFEVYLDDVQIYNWQTGLWGMVENDPQIWQQAQNAAKQEVLAKACQGKIMSLALDNAKEQIRTLFMLTGATVTITAGEAGACRMPA